MVGYLIKKRLLHTCSLIVGIAMILQLCSCTNVSKKNKFEIPQNTIIDSIVAAQNENYTLSWDSEQSAILLKDNKSGYIWSSVPYDYYLKQESNVNLSSPLFIEYYSPEDGSLQTSKAYSDCMQEGNYSVKQIDNGIRMTFHFIDAEVSVSMDFVLRKDSLAVSLPFSQIKESGKTKLIKLSFLPYFCAIPNTNEDSSYLFVPSGSGAVMYTDEDVQSIARNFNAELYGTDKAKIKLDDISEETALTMPVYGAVAGENSLMAIIEEGDGAAQINAEAGNFRNGYSTVYSTVILRSSDETEAERNNYTDVEIYAEDFNESAIYTVGYYPLEGDNSGYNGMAKRYKRYLTDNGLIKNTVANKSSYHVKLLGGTVTKKFILGLPYYSLTESTTFLQAKDIIDDLLGCTNEKPTVTLYGFGDSGVDAGKIAGGINFPSNLGGEKDYTKLSEFCIKNNIDLFYDFDIINFSASGKGISKQFDTAKTPSSQAAATYPSIVSLRTENENLKKVRLVKRSKLNSVLDKVLSFSNEKISAISLSSLFNTAYSDYSSPEYYTKGNMAQQVFELVKKFENKNYKLAGSNANGYATALADVVYDTPLDNGGYINLDKSIPFYSLVYGESTVLFSNANNLSQNGDEQILKIVESGILPSFTLISEYDDELSGSSYFDFYGTSYENQKDKMLNTLKKLRKYSETISGQYLVKHEFVTDGISKMTFSSGSEVWVNFNEFEKAINDLVIPAMDYICVR